MGLPYKSYLLSTIRWLSHSRFQGMGSGIFILSTLHQNRTLLGLEVEPLHFTKELSSYKSTLARWASEYYGDKNYLQGWFRDFYPLQYLNQKHLVAPLVENRSVADLNIGHLTPLNDERWLWELNEDEIQVIRKSVTQDAHLICPVNL